MEYYGVTLIGEPRNRRNAAPFSISLGESSNFNVSLSCLGASVCVCVWRYAAEPQLENCKPVNYSQTGHSLFTGDHSQETNSQEILSRRLKRPFTKNSKQKTFCGRLFAKD